MWFEFFYFSSLKIKLVWFVLLNWLRKDTISSLIRFSFSNIMLNTISLYFCFNLINLVFEVFGLVRNSVWLISSSEQNQGTSCKEYTFSCHGYQFQCLTKWVPLCSALHKLKSTSFKNWPGSLFIDIRGLFRFINIDNHCWTVSKINHPHQQPQCKNIN